MAPSTDIKRNGHSATGRKASSERLGSVVVDSQLAGEEDAAVLAKMGFAASFSFNLAPAFY